MNYGETINWLYSRLPMFSRQGAVAYKPSLDNTIQLCAAFGNPHTKFRSIHVAGTNGKGSVSHMLASVLQSAGYKTGLYTSPHLWDFRERIKINGSFVPENYVVSFTEKSKPLVDRFEPSFFELTVGMAFSWFAENGVDIAVIETGLGGRLDSTNVVTPVLSVITNIGWDHMAILGNTLPKIASEKAGIIKKGIPVVIGETHPETEAVFRSKAAECGSVLHFADQQRTLQEWRWTAHHLEISVTDHTHADMHTYALDLSGIYQLRNLLTVLQSIQVLQQLGWNLPFEKVRQGLASVRKQTGLHGRWETLHTKPKLIADVAHNVDGMKQVLSQLEWMDYHALHFVLGMVRDKDVDQVLALLPATARYYFTRSSIPRAMPEDELANRAEVFNLRGDRFPDVNAAIRNALSQAREEDLILVCGSVFLVGEITIPIV
jgi:dihydrofolate synthase/folylpolyglutamate synthase